MSDVKSFIPNGDLLLSHKLTIDSIIDQQQHALFLLVMTTLLEPKMF